MLIANFEERGNGFIDSELTTFSRNVMPEPLPHRQADDETLHNSKIPEETQIQISAMFDENRSRSGKVKHSARQLARRIDSKGLQSRF